RPARKAAGHSDDGNRLAGPPASRLELFVQLERQQRQPLGRELADALQEVVAHLIPFVSRALRADARLPRPRDPRSTPPGRRPTPSPRKRRLCPPSRTP